MKLLFTVGVLFLFVCIQADADDCIFTVGGKEYDLSSLKKGIQANDRKVSTYYYVISVCGNNPDYCDDIMTGRAMYGNSYQFGGETGGKVVCWDVLSIWDGNQTVSALPSNLGNDGLTFSFRNGDECRNNPRANTMNMICDESESAEGYQDPNDSCRFIIEWRTPAACSGGPGPTPTPTPSDWGINGTFSGDLTCLTTNSNLCPFNNTMVQLRGDCDKAKLVVMDKVMEVFDLNFNECGGYSATGKIESIEEDTYEFILGYSDVNNQWTFLARADDTPNQFVFEISLEQISVKSSIRNDKLLN